MASYSLQLANIRSGKQCVSGLPKNPRANMFQSGGGGGVCALDELNSAGGRKIWPERGQRGSD